jgi:DNA-binding MarR family transcriptional regulator
MLMTMNAPSRTSPLDAILLLARARAEVVRHLDRAVSGHGLGFSDFVLLRTLAAAPDGRMRRSDLADALGVTTSAVARQLGPLERIGVVDREANPRDARLALVVLTDAGARVASEATAVAEERAQSVVDGTWNEAELAQLVELLARVRS